MKIVLFEPEIPPNTGNVIRIAANTGVALHLIGPLGFALDDTRLRRAGLDYHEYASVRLHGSFAEFCAGHRGRVLGFSTRGQRRHSEIDYAPGDALLFGPETRGLPDSILSALAPEDRVRIPMQRAARSLNLANAVSIALYEALRQQGFPGLD